LSKYWAELSSIIYRKLRDHSDKNCQNIGLNYQVLFTGNLEFTAIKIVKILGWIIKYYLEET